ncbi:MAG: hypothetical protein H8E76_02475 [Helicobacteraceae bacterium]|nr:hypothetical protein [Candidatus Sulfurimonas ponti]MBL6973334.1 hypothetical protein [Sulfurimonas sp.]
MFFSGMIFQFDDEQGTGLIMLSNGETKEFSSREWVDASQAPAVGLKISYDDSGHFRKIKLFSEEENNTIAEDTKTKQDTENFNSIEEYENHYASEGFVSVAKTKDKLSMQKYSTEGVYNISASLSNGKIEVAENLDPLVSVDEHIEYFKEMGFKLANDSVNAEVREVSLRSYSMDNYGEVSIKQGDSELSVTVMMNGKKVFP